MAFKRDKNLQDFTKLIDIKHLPKILSVSIILPLKIKKNGIKEDVNYKNIIEIILIYLMCLFNLKGN